MAVSSTRFHRCGPLPGGGRETSLTLDRPDHKSSGEGGGHPPKRPRARSSRKPEGEKARRRGGMDGGGGGGGDQRLTNEMASSCSNDVR